MPNEFYADFKDKVSSAVQQRGRIQANWDDILLVSADIPETRSVLNEQGVSSGGLRRDILYAIHFGRPELSSYSAETIPFQDLHSQVISELYRDATEFSKSQKFIRNSANRAVAQRFMYFLSDYLDNRERVANDPNGYRIGLMKSKILSEALQAFAEQFNPVSDSVIKSLPSDLAPTMTELSGEFTAAVLEKFVHFVVKKGSVIVTHDQPLLILDALNQAEATQGRKITPFQAIDTARKASDPFLKYLLHRNGLMASDDYLPPCQMPHPLIIEHGLQALRYAQSIRGRVVRPAHLLPSLLEDPIVLNVIMELDEEGKVGEKEEPDELMKLFGIREGGRNFIKFRAAIQAALALKQEGERFRYRVRVTDELKEFLARSQNIAATTDETFVEAKMLGALFESDTQAKEVMLKAGLTDEQLQKWPEKVADMIRETEEAKNRRAEDEGEKKTEEDFKISDRTLKDLLDEYSVNLTKLALDGKIDPVIGRDNELYQMMRILLQRGRSNPLLLGESGVGKTALFDGLAQMIASGRAPKPLIGARVIKPDLNAMNSGATFRGEFEARLLPIIQGIAERNARGDKPPIILCIDELHTALMAGAASNTPGAGELLKPYLTRGELSVIGATTQRDFAKYIAVDTALERRFQPIFIDEPGYENTLKILKGLKDPYSSYHQLEISDDLLDLIVKLSSRYLPNQQQPDKAIRVLDASLARARMSEKEAVGKADIYETVAAEAKINPEFLMEGEEEKFLRLEGELPKQVLGQPLATSYIPDALITAKADLQDPRKPLAVILALGPTGVGKTETARALSRLLHGSEDNLIRIDMSDYMETHRASKLFGAAPEYIGYGEEGLLTGAVRKKPYSVVLLDEIDKPNPEVLKQLLPIFEEGEIRDGRGQRISFRNTLIIMTSNVGAQAAVAEAEAEGIDPQAQPEEWAKVTAPIYQMAAKERFVPEFLNRIDHQITYSPLSKEVIGELVQTEVNVLSERTKQKYGLGVQITPEVRDELATTGYNPEYGARELKRVVKNQLTQPLAKWILRNKAKFAAGSIAEVNGLNSNFNVEVIPLQDKSLVS